jgi:hypothetical protein
MTTNTDGRRRSSLLDPLIVGLVVMAVVLWRTQRHDRDDLLQIVDDAEAIVVRAATERDIARHANAILSEHTRRLARELLDAQVDLQTTIAADLGDFASWDVADRENEPLRGPLTASEPSSGGNGREGTRPALPPPPGAPGPFAPPEERFG